jgi:hypothetical protein
MSAMSGGAHTFRVRLLAMPGLQEEGKMQQRKGAAEKKEPSDLKPLGNLDKLT